VSVVANVAINVDASRATQQLRAVQQGAQSTNQAIDKLNATTAAVESKFKVAANGVKYFTDATGRARAENGRFLSSTERAAAGITAQGRAAEQASAKMRGLSGVVAELQGVLAAATPWIALATGIAAATGASLKFSNEVDRNRQQLTLFTKDVNATNAIIAQLKVTADATSLGLPGLLEATKTLAAYGLRAKDAGTATKLLGDLALGDNEKLQRFAVNLGQISSIGKAYTVDLKQFAMAGIPIFEALSKVMNVSTGEVLKLAEQGKVTYPIVIKAIDELTKKGASFYEGATKGGTDLDRATAQLQGSFESLQTVIGTAVAPLVIKAVNEIKKAVDGLLLLVRQVTNEFQYWGKQKIPLGPFDSWAAGVKSKLKDLQDYIDANPGLKVMLGYATGGAAGALKVLAPSSSASKASTPAVDRAGLLKSAQEIARKSAEAEAANIKLETNKKIAKVNQDAEKQLADNRIQYERQIADFRESTIQRIMDMERSLQDQRVKAEFDLQQSNAKLAGTRQYSTATDAIIAAASAGKDTSSLIAERESQKMLNDAAINRRQIEFDGTQRKIQLERALTDFKRETERSIGEMQKNYARQTGDIIIKAGKSVGELMVKGAQDAAKILQATKPTMPTQPSPIGPAVTKGIIGRTGSTGDSTAPHLDIRWADERPITKADADKYFALNGRAPSSYGVTSGYGPRRSLFGRSFHAGMDFGTPSGTPISLKGGAALTKNLGYTGAGGYEAEISTPQGAMRILHLLANSVAKIPTAAKAGPAAAAVQAPAGSRAMQVDAANAIRPFAAPSTATLDQLTADLKRTNELQNQNNLLADQQNRTKDLKNAELQVIQQSMAALVNAQEKNALDQATLNLIKAGINPELATQLAINKQNNDLQTVALKNQLQIAKNSLNEKGITAETATERMGIVNNIAAQLYQQDNNLAALNEELYKTKEIASQRDLIAMQKQTAMTGAGLGAGFIGQAGQAFESEMLKSGDPAKAAMLAEQTQALELATTKARALESAYQDIGTAMASTLTEGVAGLVAGTTTAQQVFSDFLKGVGDALMKAAQQMIAQYLAIAAAKSLAGLFGGGSLGGGGAGGAADGSAFGATAFGGGVGSNAGFEMPSILGRAAGGPVAGGTPYVVGERGPELFVPGSSGTIVPAGPTASLRESMGSPSAGGTSPVLNMTFETTRINGTEYVSREQLEAAMMQTRRQASADGARRGMSMTLDKLQQSPQTRSRVGIG
jgi:tape measure domain-containing protein